MSGITAKRKPETLENCILGIQPLKSGSHLIHRLRDSYLILKIYRKYPASMPFPYTHAPHQPANHIA